MMRWEEPPAAYDGPMAEPGSRWTITDLTFMHETFNGRARLIGVLQWLDANPGCWALVGTFNRVGVNRERLTGWAHASVSGHKIPLQHVDGKLYAQSASAEAAELTRVLEHVAGQDAFEWPKLERDPFDWSLTELRKAASTARDWLFPMESHAVA